MKVKFALKGNGNKNFYISSHLKEIQQQYIEVYYKFFISVLLQEIYSHLAKSTSCPPNWINF